MELNFPPNKMRYSFPSPAATAYTYNNIQMLPSTAFTNSTISPSCFSTASNLIFTNKNIYSSIHNSRPGTCRAADPSPPESEPPTRKPTGVPTTLSRFKDTAQVFVAVMFWMGVFFWVSAWDGRDNGRSDKGPRF